MFLLKDDENMDFCILLLMGPYHHSHSKIWFKYFMEKHFLYL